MNRNHKMTCEHFAGVSRDYARRKWMSVSDLEAADAHVSQCETCRQLADYEVALGASLQWLQQQQASVGASLSTELAVMAAFRAAKHSPAVHSRLRAAAWLIPIAAMFAAAFFLTRPNTPTMQPPQPVVQTRAPEVAGPPEEPPVVAVAPPVGGRRAATVAPRASLAVAREQVTDFVPLRYGKPVDAGEPLQVVRIQLPRAELTRLGLPVSPEGGRAMVKADVALGDDGLVKAIRFVY
ncbi:MAG: hypothetical protein HY820_05145 [Acidobacteria bacterium]|nr:hypothetical protein [Acidobacteriota bacterium]